MMMGRLPRFAFRLAAAIAAASLLAAVAGWLFLRSTLPQTDGRVVVPGLSAEVTVWRDAWGVPTIRAGTSADAAEALGFLHASDRLWQMELRRRAAAGRLSEIFGAGAVNADLRLRQRNLTALAAEDWRRSIPAERAVLDAYARGVNAYIETHRWRLPPEFLILRFRPEPWRPEDSLAFLRLMLSDLADSAAFERTRLETLRRLGPERARDLFSLDTRFTASPLPSLDDLARLASLAAGEDAPPPPGESPPVAAGINTEAPAAAASGGRDAAPGSNGWVVPSQRSSSGRPLVANDPHLGVELPAVWYEAGLISPEYEARGLTLAGLPLVAIGRGPHIAWGITVHPADDQDLFLERLDDTDPPRVQDGWSPGDSGEQTARWIPVARRMETIGVRDEAPVIRSIDSTPRGVIVERGSQGEPALALRTASSAAHGSFGILLDLARARDAGQLLATLQLYDDTPLCLTFADDAGRSGLQTIGYVPVRARGDGSLPAEGWGGGEPWVGRVAWDGMIAVRPDAAIGAQALVAANDRLRPDGEPDGYPGDWVAPARAERIAQLLGSREAWSLPELETIQTDVLSRRAEKMLPALEAILSRSAGLLSPEAARATAALRGWDRRMSLAGPSRLWAEVLPALQDQLGGEESGFDSAALVALVVREASPACAAAPREASCGLDWFDDPATTAHEDARDRIAAALETAWRGVTAAEGDDPSRWSWGGTHTITFEHSLSGQTRLSRWLDLGPVGMPGGNDTVNVQIAAMRGVGPIHPIFHIPSARVLFDLADPDHSFSVLPTGQSGHPLSPHYGDQLPLWAAGDYHPAPFTQAAAAAAAVETLVLAPF